MKWKYVILEHVRRDKYVHVRLDSKTRMTQCYNEWRYTIRTIDTRDIIKGHPVLTVKASSNVLDHINNPGC